MPFFPLRNDPNANIDQRSVAGKDNILTDTKGRIDPATPAHVVSSMPPPLESKPTGSALEPRIKSSPLRESPISSQKQQQNQQKHALITNSQAENKKRDDHLLSDRFGRADMPKAQQKDEPKREYPDRDDGKSPSNTPGTTAHGPGVSIQFTISVGAPNQHKSLDVNIPTTFLVNGQKVIPNNSPQTIPKPQSVIPNNTDPQAVPKPQVISNNTPQTVPKPRVIPNNTPQSVPMPRGMTNITPRTDQKPQDESFCQRCQKHCSIL